MKVRSLKVCFRQGFQGIWRNRLMVLVSILTVSACLFILGVVYSIVANVRAFTQDLDDSLGIIAFLSENVEEETIPELLEQIRGMENVKEVTYVSADQAWTDFKDMMGFEEQLGDRMIARLDADNPLAGSASFKIFLNEPSAQEEFIRQVEVMPQFRKLRYSEETADVLSSLTNMVTLVGLGLIILLVFIAILLISNTIKLSVFVRRKEIGIMKYIGATNSFVKIPFVVEGMIIGVLGAIIPIILMYFSYGAIVNLLTQQFNTFTNLVHFLDVNTIILQMIPIFLCVGLVVGMLGSLFSIRKYLRV